MATSYRRLVVASTATIICGALFFAGSAHAGVAQPGIAMGPAGAAFYTPPKSLLKGAPGSVIWTRAIKYSAAGRVALRSASKTVLVLYRSRDLNGDPVAVSGTVDIPKGKAPAGGWPIISWYHGTVGVADVCAPSRTVSGGPADGYINYATPTYDAWLKKGYAVLRSDFIGLGTSGPHRYLIGHSAARGGLDIIPAARRLFPTLGKNVVFGGHSQGGQAALFAAADAKKLAPGLKLKGVFVYAPANHILEQRLLIANLGDPFKALSGLVVMIFNSAAREAGVDPKTLVQPEIAAKLGELEKVCAAELGSADLFGKYAPNQILKAGVETPTIDAVIKKMNPDLKIAVPILILQGVDDATVYEFYTKALKDELVVLRDRVTYSTFEGLAHTTVVTDARPMATVLAFLKARFGS